MQAEQLRWHSRSCEPDCADLRDNHAFELCQGRDSALYAAELRIVGQAEVRVQTCKE